MTEAEPDLKRLRPLYVLDILSSRLRSDVLAGGAVAAKYDLHIKHPMEIVEGMVVLRGNLLGALRSAVDSLPVQKLRDQSGADTDTKITINTDGSGTIEAGTRKLRFAWVTLLSADPQKRLTALNTFLLQFPVNESAAASLRSLVQRPNYSDDDFASAVTLIESSPEMFCERVREKLRRPGDNNRLGADDLLPDDIRYWDHLIAPVKESVTLAEYIEHELKEEWQTRLSIGPNYALHSMAMTFGAPALVPHALLQELDAQALTPIIESLSKVDDHFSLEGAFEICAGRFNEDQRFIALGEQLLDHLFADKERLAATCGLFGAIFVVTTAHLAEHEILGRRPVYWRRVAAVAHASLVARICASAGFKPEEISKWAMRVAGETYFLSVLSEFAAEPQWRPEWIVTHFLVADVFGRAMGTLHRIGVEQSPPSWRQKIEKAHEWIVEDMLDPFTQYPAVLEGTRRPKRPTLAEFSAINFTAGTEMYAKLKSDPSISNLLAASPLIEALGFPAEVTDDVFRVLDQLRKQPRVKDKDRSTSIALSVIAHIAVLIGNKEMADGVAEVSLTRSRTYQASDPVFETLARLVECSAAIANPEAARGTLVNRLEALSFTLPASEITGDLLSAMQKLMRVQPELGPLLGRAIATARLGYPRSNAA